MLQGMLRTRFYHKGKNDSVVFEYSCIESASRCSVLFVAFKSQLVRLGSHSRFFVGIFGTVFPSKQHSFLVRITNYNHPLDSMILKYL